MAATGLRFAATGQPGKEASAVDEYALDDKPIADVIDQRLPARPEDAVDEDDGQNSVTEATTPLEADPADVADQHRTVPMVSDNDFTA